jgi:calcium permeable stress-gated cation channel
LIGLFGARKASGPSTLMIILLVATILYHSIINRILASVKANFAVSEEGETVPLLAAEENGVEPGPGHLARSKSAEVGLSPLPSFVSEPIASVIESYIASSRNTVTSWVNDPYARQDEDEIRYTDEEVKNAYLNPALTSKMPKLWLVKDDASISKQEIAENEAAGIQATDEGASLDSHNHIKWAQDDLSKVPIFKMPVRY